MRLIALILIIAGLPTIALGAEKPTTRITPPPPSPDVLRLGGDTIETAIEITYNGGPYFGTTTGYTHDYDEACPYEGSTSPDVVYVIEGGGSAYERYFFDLQGSSYDTKIYVYDSAGELVGCDDDGNPDFTSNLMVCFLEHDTYFVVIDGYGGDHGDYVLNVTIFVAGYVDCLGYLWPEGELLEDEVLDTYNCGCDCADQVPRIQPLVPDSGANLAMCGQLGWTSVAGEIQHDTDWLSLMVGPTGTVHGEIISTHAFAMPVYLAGDCDELQLLQVVDVGPIELVEFDITAPSGQEVWLVTSTIDTDPPCGGVTPQAYDYELYLQGLELPVAVEATSWTAVKSLYR